jgi:hypothetical protein
MLNIDPGHHLDAHRQELMAQAERQRLIALLPPRTSPLRHKLALVCQRLANWLDHPDRYVQPVEPGPEHWATPSASA